MKKIHLIYVSLLVALLTVSGCYTTYESWAFNHGVYNWRKGNYKEAVRSLENVLKHDPQNADAHMWLALTYEDLGDYDKAKEYFSKAVALDPRFGRFYDVGSNKVESADIRRGWREIDGAHNRSGYKKIGYDQAITSFNLALKKNPRSAEAYMGLAIVWGDQGNYDKAMEFLSKAIEMEPKAGYFWFRGEMRRRNKKDFERAVEDYNKILELIPADDQSPYAVRARKIALEAIGDLQKKLKK